MPFLECWRHYRGHCAQQVQLATLPQLVRFVATGAQIAAQYISIGFYADRKIDPSAYKKLPGDAFVDADSVRHFRKVERRLDEVFNVIPKKHLNSQVRYMGGNYARPDKILDG